ncbi:PAS domain S-box protein [Microvirga roseola]|uniref:PAS domain S-box protein n=1 Tax=Microvirga roseola TaxID=2883126 RepID=UPI001E488D9B|nr:PAS domain S-box protein [Microvirga roseola]
MREGPAGGRRKALKIIDFEALFSSSPNPYVLLDPFFVIVGMNDAYLRATMRERSELVGRNMFDAFPSDPDSASYRKLRASLERVVREKTSDHLPLIQYDIPLPGGQGFEERYWSTTHTPLFNRSGEFVFILQHTVDVTELQRLRVLAQSSYPSGHVALIETDVLRRAKAVQEANEALKEEQEHLRGLFEQAPGFMAALSGPQHVFTMANAAYFRLVGRQDIIGKTVREALPEVVGQGFIELLDRVYSSGQPFVGRGIRILLGQEQESASDEHYVDFVYQPIRANDGTVSGIFVQGHDVTEQRRAVEAFRASEARLRLAVEAGRMATWEIDAATDTIVSSPELNQLLGFPAASQPSTAEIRAGYYPGERDRLLTAAQKAVARGERYIEQEFRYVWPDGSIRWLLLRAELQLNSEGAPTKAVGVVIDITDRKTTEEALRESEERFRLVAERAPVMLWMGDQNGKCVYLNRAQREFWGVESEDVAGFDWGTTIYPDDQAVLYDALSHAMQTQTGFTVEARFRRSDGEYRIVQTNAQPRFGPSGEFLGMIGVNVDITETRRAEEALRTETRNLAVLNRTGASIAAELDLDRIVQAVTDAGVELTGAQFGAFFYNTLNDRGESYMLYSLSGVPREAFSRFPMPRATAVFQPTFRGEGVIRSDDILQDPRYGRSGPYNGMPEGHLPVRSYLAVPVTSRSGEVIGGLFFGHAEPGVFRPEHETLLLGIAAQAAIAVDNARLFQAAQRELEERRRVEAALRESEERFRAIANSIDQLIWATRPDGFHDYFNQRWYEFTGAPEGSTDGQAWNGILHPDDRDRARSMWLHSLATGEPYHIEYRLRHRSGEYRWVLGRAQPVRDEQGRITRWFGTCTDIHDLKQVQEELRASREHALRTESETRRLAAVLAERVGELDEANEEIQRFAYIVSHDLRAPLVNVMGFTSELETAQAEIESFYRKVAQSHPELISSETRNVVETDLAEAIGFIRTSTVKMDKLINAILRLSREGRRVLAPENLSMRQVLEAQRQSLAHQLSERGVELMIEDVPDLVSDRLAIEQVFGNLLDNAVKYLGPDRPGRIFVRGSEAGPFVRYEVEDNGRGIDPKDFDRIFDLFRRSGAQDQPGEGIGLAHVRALVRRLGGTITVSSKLGEGSVFTVTLPKYVSMSSEAA